MTFPISPTLRVMLEAIVAAGGRPAIIGGSVRDWVLGLEPKDIDVEVYGLDVADLELALSKFKVDAVGRAFGVFKVTIEGETFDVSLPRRESKEGHGHRGFMVSSDPTMTPEEAALRRDFTVNTLGWDFIDGKLMDFHGGMADIKAKVLRHTSPAFAEDPLRVLRGCQFAGRFGFTMDGDTIDMCLSLTEELRTLPVERLWTEWVKLLTKSPKPSVGLTALVVTGAIEVFPEVKALWGLPQEPAWHPEGWSLTPASPLIDTGVAVPTTAQESVRDLFTRLAARAASVGLHRITPSDSVLSDVTSVAESMSFVASAGTSAVGAREIHRVMLEVPLPSVDRIVASALDDLKILEAIVRPISVSVMDMFMPGKTPVEFEFHEQAVKRNGPLATGPTGVPVPVSIVVDARSASIDGHVLCTVDFAVFDDNIHVAERTAQLTCWKATMNSLWVHNCMVTDMAVRVLDDDGVTDAEERLIIILGAFCHDFGKPATTVFERDRWRSLAHEEAGEAPTRSFLTRIGAPHHIIEAVVPLVMQHLKPFHLARDKASSGSVRRLALKVPLERLCRVGRADFLGRTTPDALAITDSREVEETKWLLERAIELAVRDSAPQPLVMGRHLIDAGMKPSREFGEVLKRAFEYQLDGFIFDEESALRFVKEKVVVTADGRGQIVDGWTGTCG